MLRINSFLGSRITGLLLLGWIAFAALPPAATAEPLQVVTTTPNLAALVEAVGGSDVQVRSLARPGEDPHFVEARPSFVRMLHSADLFVVVGLDLGVGYVPALIAQARNPEIQPGGLGYFDASVGVDKILPNRSGIMARALGDVHPMGNPHYLSDPVEGLRVARRLAERLSRLDPSARSSFEKNYVAFRDELLTKLYGDRALSSAGPKALATASFEGTAAVRRLLGSQGVPVGGWEKEIAPYRGTLFVADHNLWPYFARRFGLEQLALLEPYPGVSPTVRHLQKVIEEMRAKKVPIILSSSYFRDAYAKKVARETDARVVPMTEQVGVKATAGSYIEMTQNNLDSVVGALKQP